MKPTLVIMCGVPGSGKDYEITHNSLLNNNRPTVIVSRDKIRFSFLKDEDSYFDYEQEVWREFIEQICKGLAQGKTVIANATHIGSYSRKKIILAIDSCLGSKDYNVICFAIVKDISTILRQNNLRNGKERVPEEIVRKMYKQFTIPAFSEDPRYESIIIQGSGSEPIVMRKE